MTRKRKSSGGEGEQGKGVPGKKPQIMPPQTEFEKHLDQHGLYDGRSQYIKRKEDGGHPRPGRPKGAKNKLTLLKEAVINEAEDIILDNLGEIVQQACKMAKRGDTRAMKLVMDRILPARKVVDDNTDKGSRGVTINITGNVQVKEDIEGEIVNEDA